MSVGGTRKPVTPSSTRPTAPVARAATTGTPAAIASSVTLPKVSVTHGLKNTSIDATARPRSSPDWKPANTASGTRSANQSRAGPFADHQHLVRHAALVELADHVGEDVEALFHHQPAEKADRDLVVGDPERAPPFEIAARRREAIMIHAARPDRDRRRHAPVAEDLRHAAARHHHLVDAIVEARQDLDHQRLEERQLVIAEIGFEPRVERGDRRDAALRGHS